MSFEITRRGFVAGLGAATAGLALGWRTLVTGLADAGAATPAVFAPNPFIQIGVDGVVTIVCHRSEMGQGIRSSLPVLIADELGADPAKIRVVQGDGDEKYGDQNTDGSTSIRNFFEPMRAGRGGRARDADRRRRGALARARRAAHRPRRRGPRSADPAGRCAFGALAARRRRAAGAQDRRAAPARRSSSHLGTDAAAPRRRRLRHRQGGVRRRRPAARAC